MPASAELSLVLAGPELFAEDRSVLERLAAAAARAWETQHLTTLADQLASADQVRSALLAAVGHDLRTPLGSLKAAVSSLRQDDVEWAPDEQPELLATIEESADRLDDLIANMLDMSRIQAGAITPRWTWPSTRSSRSGVGLPVGRGADPVPEDLPLVWVDPGLLERVVANMLDNAVAAQPGRAPGGGGARVTGGGVELRVVGPRRRRPGGPVGLDVPAVPAARRPSDRRRCRARARDRARILHGDGHPRRAGRDAGRRPDHGPAPAAGAPMTRILVVDDDAALLRALAINLKARHLDVGAASDGTAALRSAASTPPDLVILDLGLPDLDGVEVVAGLRGWTSVPIIVLSARDTQSAKVDALDAGADDYITKPFGMDELLARMRAALRRATPATQAPVIVTADFTVDLAAKRVTRAGAPVRLTPDRVARARAPGAQPRQARHAAPAAP